MFYNKELIKARNASISVPVQQTNDINGLFIRKLATLMSDNCRLLDIGTGNGFVLRQILDYINIKAMLFGVDNSEEMIKEAMKNLGNNATIIKGDNNALPFENEEFDIVTAKNVTRYSTEELYRILKKNGYFVFREYGPAKGIIELFPIFQERLIRSREVYFYSSKLQDAGFEIISIEQYQVQKKYNSVEEIINITKSFPYINDYSLEDEEIIRRELKGNCQITSDPFILVAKKIERW